MQTMQTEVAGETSQRVQECLKNIQVWPHWGEIAQGALKESGISAEVFYEALPEYQRFMALSAFHRGMGMFSEKVDTLWHAHILNTLRYQEFCEQVIGRFVHHLPCSSFGLYLNPAELANNAFCEDPATCYDPGDEPAPDDGGGSGDDSGSGDDESMASGIRACAQRFVTAYRETYQCPPPVAIYTRLAKNQTADGIAQ